MGDHEHETGVRDSIILVRFVPLVVQWGAVLFVGLVSLLLTIFIARSIGPESFGVYASALAAGALVVIFIDGGMRALILRERSRASVRLRAVAEVLPGYALGHALVTATLFSLFSLLLFSGESLILSQVTIACFFVVAITQMTSSIFRGEGQIVWDAGFQIGGRAVTALAMALLVWLGLHMPWQVIGIWAVAGLAFLVPFRKVWQRPKLTGLNKIYRAVLPFFILDLAITVYIRSDLLVLNYFQIDSSLIGQYAAAFRVCEAFILLVGPVGLMVFRHLRVKEWTVIEIRQQLQGLLFAATLFGGVVVSGVYHFSEDIVLLLYGDQYTQSVEFLQVLSWMLFFVAPNMVLNQAALAAEMEYTTMRVAVLLAMMNVAGNMLLIPVYGVTAAVWLTVFTEAMMFLIMLVMWFRPLSDKVWSRF